MFSIEIDIRPEHCTNNPETDAFCMTSGHLAQELSYKFLVTMTNQ